MRNYFNKLPLLLMFLASACGTQEVDKKEELEKLKAEYADLALKIKTLEKEVAAEGDSSMVESKLPVKADTVTFEPFVHYLEVQGVVEAEENILVSPETSGLVRSIKVKEGMTVKKGQVLLTVDTDILAKNVKEVESRLSLAKTIFEKQERLWNEKIGSEVQYLEAKNNKESLEKNLATLRTQISKGYVTAPVSGVVEEIYPKEGEMVMPQSPAVRIVNLSNVHIEAEMSEAYIGKVKAGDKVKVEFPMLGEEPEGVVTSVGQYINPNNRTFRINVKLANRQGNLKPNLLSVVKVADFATERGLTVNSNLIQFDKKGNYVFVINKENNILKAKKTYINSGASYKGKTLIKEGLEDGAVVINQGARSVADGQRVELLK